MNKYSGNSEASPALLDRLAVFTARRKESSRLDAAIQEHPLRAKLQHLATLYLRYPHGWEDNYAKEFVNVASWMAQDSERSLTTNPGPVVCCRCFANRGICHDRAMLVPACKLCIGSKMVWYDITRLDWLASMVAAETGLHYWFVEDAFARAARSYGQRHATMIAEVLKQGAQEWHNE